MIKSKLIWLMCVVVMVSFSSCGIFGKGCGCPTFGVIKNHPNHLSKSSLTIAVYSPHLHKATLNTLFI